MILRHVCLLAVDHWRGKTLLFLCDSRWFTNHSEMILEWFLVIIGDLQSILKWFSSNSQWFVNHSETILEWFTNYSEMILERFSNHSEMILSNSQWFVNHSEMILSDLWSIHRSFSSNSWWFTNHCQMILEWFLWFANHSEMIFKWFSVICKPFWEYSQVILSNSQTILFSVIHGDLQTILKWYNFAVQINANHQRIFMNTCKSYMVRKRRI